MHPTVFIYDLKIIAQTQKALELKVALRAVERIMLVLTLREKNQKYAVRYLFELR